MAESPYLKYFYWINADQISIALDETRNQLHLEDIPQAKLRQCEALYPKCAVMHVPPEIWSNTCVRQGSWFRTSPWAEAHLIVSNDSLTLSGVIHNGTIQLISLEEWPISQIEDYEYLLHDPRFISRAPEEWFHLLPDEIPLYQAFLDRNNQDITLDQFIQMHSANHANFILPETEIPFTAEIDGKSVARSLFPQLFICSACVEIFGVIGNNLPQMVIKKCPGLKYVSLDPAEYFLITNLPNPN